MIALRVDASRELGGGHLSRCLALAGALRAAGDEIHVITRVGPGDATVLLTRNGIPHTPLAAGEDDVTGTLAALSRLPTRPSWLVVDHYGLAAPWETAMRAQVDHVLAIDDLANRPHDCDVLLDQNPFDDGAERYAGKVPPGCVLLLGLDHALLRPEFARVRATLQPRPPVIRSVMVSMGGADPDNRTLDVIRGYQATSLDRLHVVIGGHTAHRDELLRVCASDPRITAHVNVENMADLLAHTDLAVGSLGVATWERFCLGVPSLVVGLNATHDPIATRLDGRGLIRYLGPAQAVAPADYAAALDAAARDPSELVAMAARGSALVDGQGTQRVSAALHRISGLRAD